MSEHDFEKQAQEVITKLDAWIMDNLATGRYPMKGREGQEYLRGLITSALSSAASAARAQGDERLRILVEALTLIYWGDWSAISGADTVGEFAKERLDHVALVEKHEAAEIRALAPTPPAAAQLPPGVEANLEELRSLRALMPSVEKLVEAVSYLAHAHGHCESRQLAGLPGPVIASFAWEDVRDALAPFRAKDDRGRT